MSGRNDLLLLDTNIVIHLIRDNEVGRRVDAVFQIRHRADRPLIMSESAHGRPERGHGNDPNPPGFLTPA